MYIQINLKNNYAAALFFFFYLSQSRTFKTAPAKKTQLQLQSNE